VQAKACTPNNGNPTERLQTNLIDVSNEAQVFADDGFKQQDILIGNV
jgi:hypothetical protein